MFTLLKNATVYSPAPLGPQDIVVAGGRIVGLGVGLSAGAGTLQHTEEDWTGLTVIPGLVDAHIHATGGGGESGPSTRVPRIALSHLTSAGVTSCVGVLGTDGRTRTMRDLVSTTMGLRELGLSAWCYTGNYHYPPITLTGSVQDDIVFIDPIIGVGELALSDHRSSQITLQEFLRVSSDAYVAGMIANKAGIVHCHMGSGPRGFELIEAALDQSEIPARVFHPTHINRERWLFERAPSLAERGCSVDITAFPDDGETMLAAEAIAKWQRDGHPMERLTCSSDGAGCLPQFDEDGRLKCMDVGRPDTLNIAIRTLLSEGLPLETFLPVFTSNVARLMALPNKGTIEVGQDADLVALDESGRVQHVLANGRTMVRDGAVVEYDPFEKRP